MYEKLAGMTGTAATEADELFDIYKLEVVEIPTNVQVARLDEDDEVYRTQNENTPRSWPRSNAPTSGCSLCWSARPRSRSPRCWPNT
jgi:hypothetical protein